jgi:dual oxidase maturation factor 1
MLPNRPLLIHLEDMVLQFQLGWCFWLVLTAGSLCLVIGISISVIDLVISFSF